MVPLCSTARSSAGSGPKVAVRSSQTKGAKKSECECIALPSWILRVLCGDEKGDACFKEFAWSFLAFGVLHCLCNDRFLPRRIHVLHPPSMLHFWVNAQDHMRGRTTGAECLLFPLTGMPGALLRRGSIVHCVSESAIGRSKTTPGLTDSPANASRGGAFPSAIDFPTLMITIVFVVRSVPAPYGS